MTARSTILQLGAVLSLAALAAAPVAAAPAAAPLGTWKGKIVPSERTYTIPSITLVVAARGLETTVTGLTGASHDPPTATTSCSVAYRLVGQSAGWLYYEQAAPSRMTAVGYVEGAPCGADGRRSPGGVGYVLRLRPPPPGGKLAVQVSTWIRSPKSLPETIEALRPPAWRGFLTR